MGPDGIQSNDFINAVGKTADGKFVAEGTYATIGSVSDLELPPSGKKFLTDFSAKFGIAPEKIEVYSKYGYASMQVALAAISKVCKKDRAAILEAMLATKDLDTVVGKLTFDKNGDTTATTMTGYVVSAKGLWPGAAFPGRAAPRRMRGRTRLGCGRSRAAQQNAVSSL